MRYFQPAVNVNVTTHPRIEQYLPPDTPQECTLAEYRALLSVALRNVREQFVERETERKAALKETALKKAALKKAASKKEASHMEPLKKVAGNLSSRENKCQSGGEDSARRRS